MLGLLSDFLNRQAKFPTRIGISQAKRALRMFGLIRTSAKRRRLRKLQRQARRRQRHGS